jgi:hypothetical protein
MATYSMEFNPNRSSYEVEMEDDVGGHTVLGFQTEAAAQAWVEEDRRTNTCVLPDVEPYA